MESDLIEETFGRWFEKNKSVIDLRDIKITSRRRQNLQGSILNAAMVITNNDSLNHLEDHK